MPLIEPAIKQKLQTEIINELKALSKGADKSSIDDSHKKLAAAIAAAVAKVMVAELTKNAQVAPGIPSTPAATVGPGKIT